jgi:hypothetical protein
MQKPRLMPPPSQNKFCESPSEGGLFEAVDRLFGLWETEGLKVPLRRGRNGNSFPFRGEELHALPSAICQNQKEPSSQAKEGQCRRKEDTCRQKGSTCSQKVPTCREKVKHCTAQVFKCKQKIDTCTQKVPTCKRKVKR